MSSARDDRDDRDSLEHNRGNKKRSREAVCLPGEEIGEMHFSTENYSTALEYFNDALSSSELADYPDRFRLHLRISDCHRKKGNFAEAKLCLDRARRIVPENEPGAESEHALGKIEYRKAYLLLWQGNYEKALKLGFRSYRRLKHTEEHSEVAYIQLLVANCYQRLGLMDEAEEFFMDALSSYRRVDDRVGIAYAYNSLGLLHKNACRWNRALASITKSLDIAKTLGLTQHLIVVQLNLGVVYGKLRRFPDAISALTTALKMAERFGDQHKLTMTLLMLGRTYVQCGEFPKAEKQLLRAQAAAGEHGYLRESALADEYFGELMIARGDIQAAMVNLRSALEKGRALAPEGDVVAESLRRIADVQYLLNRPDDALANVAEGIEIAETCREFYELGYFYRTKGLALVRLDRTEDAEESLRISVDKFEEYGNPLEKGISQQLLARLHMREKGEKSLLRARQVLSDSVVEFGRLEDGQRQILSQVLLAGVERRLGNLDDALLAVYEADRLVEQENIEKFRKALPALRRKIEEQMSNATTRVLDQFSILGNVGNGARSREQLVKGLDSTLKLILDKLGAGSGFVAIPRRKGNNVHIVSREGTTRSEAQAILSWFNRTPRFDDPSRGFLLSDLENNPETASLRDELDNQAGALLMQRLGFEGEDLGVLCVRQAVDVGANAHPMGQEALNFVGAYSSLISLSVYEIVRSERQRQTRNNQVSEGFQSVVTDNKEMIKLLNLCERVAHSDATVMLQGETGTGKGLIAYAIHLLSERRDRKFIHVNCAALPEQLLESELFGHVRGAFTGAFADKEGLLKEADGGTIFLDEIGKTSLAMQGKLLQFLDTCKVRKVGSNKMIPVEVRVVCASKANLLKLCEDGRFLEDFFYRINDFPLTVPPLRERVEDVTLLMNHYVDKISQEMNREINGVTDEFLEKLKAYRWPGNVRELEKAIKRAIILADDGDALSIEHLAPEVAETRAATECEQEPLTLRERIARVEQTEILGALRRCEWNKSRTAILLGISYPNLLSKIKRYNIQ